MNQFPGSKSTQNQSSAFQTTGLCLVLVMGGTAINSVMLGLHLLLVFDRQHHANAYKVRLT